jgi:hypothetical protein
VLSIDEKSQIQALERSAPILSTLGHNSTPRSQRSSPAGKTAATLFVWNKTADQILAEANRQNTSNAGTSPGTREKRVIRRVGGVW